MRLPVRRPFRLDLTVDALRRLAANAVDVAGSDGTYFRAMRDEQGAALVGIRAGSAGSIEVRASGRDAERWLPCVRRLLGTDADLREWYARSATIPWLCELSHLLTGLKPPRYPTLWEACAHAVVFAQISIHAGAAIMRRLVEALAEEVVAGDVRGRIFPEPERWLGAREAVLRGAGLSANKSAYLRSSAAAFADGSMSEDRLDALTTEDAAAALCAIRGIGPWSAAVALLRGMGRLDVFPLRDSGVARSLVHAGGESLDDVLETLGPVRGMLYFHLLLARLHPSAAQPAQRSTRSKKA